MPPSVLPTPLAALCLPLNARSYRASSWDRSGGNRDLIVVGPGETKVLLDVAGPGCVTQFYCALAFPALNDYRDAILRCFWDDEPAPSVEVPLGDFFCLSHARTRPLSSAIVNVHPGVGASYGLSAYFAMPFASRALITLEHHGTSLLAFYAGRFEEFLRQASELAGTKQT